MRLYDIFDLSKTPSTKGFLQSKIHKHCCAKPYRIWGWVIVSTKFSTNLSFLFHRNGVHLYVPIVFTPMVFFGFHFLIYFKIT